jgi:hypothetical protein
MNTTTENTQVNGIDVDALTQAIGAIAADPAKGIMLYGSMGTWLNEFLQNAARDLTKETGRACATSSGPPVRPKLVS